MNREGIKEYLLSHDTDIYVVNEGEDGGKCVCDL